MVHKKVSKPTNLLFPNKQGEVLSPAHIVKLNMAELYSSAFTLDYTIDLMMVAKEVK